MKRIRGMIGSAIEVLLVVMIGMSSVSVTVGAEGETLATTSIRYFGNSILSGSLLNDGSFSLTSRSGLPFCDDDDGLAMLSGKIVNSHYSSAWVTIDSAEEIFDAGLPQIGMPEESESSLTSQRRGDVKILQSLSVVNGEGSDLEDTLKI